MKIERLNSKNVQDWRNFFNKNKNSMFYHDLEFGKFLEKTYKNCKLKYFLSKNNALFPFFLVKSKLLGNRIICLPFLDNAGFLGKYNKNDLKELLENLKKEDVKHIEIRFNSFSKNFKKDSKILQEIGFKKESSKQQFIIKLTNEEEMWKRFHKHTRNDIRKAEKSSLKLKKMDSETEIKKFYKLYVQNMKFFGTPQHSYDFFKNFFNFMKENFFGLNCYFKNKLIGSIIMFYREENGYISYNVSDVKFREYRPNDLLYWKTIKWAMENKVKFIDMGQIDPDSSDSRAIGLYKFKRKWLGDAYDRFYFYYSSKKTNKPETERKDSLKKLRNTWKKLPTSGIKIAGPKIASQLGI